ncbi:MAG: BREX-1 system phosphatase PglZ type A [Fibrobacteres bacterium]|nr:BREX-1 system phosphatase PglZ type A [Fibrobacterota bacterium]
MKRIHESLSRVLNNSRIVFWYDPERQWELAYESFSYEGVKKIKVEGNEFGTKVAIHKDLSQAQYLLYLPIARPIDSENWLLDLLLQSHEYKADRASLALQEVGLTYDLHYLVEAHLDFFRNQERINSFKKMLKSDCDPEIIRLKMMAVIAGAEPDVDQILHCFIRKALTAKGKDPASECFHSANLLAPFWKMVSTAFGYISEQPSIRDFIIALFRYSNPLDTGVTLDAHARVFMNNWKKNHDLGSTYRSWAERLEADLHIIGHLETLHDVRLLEQADTFPSFDKFILDKLCQDFMSDAPANGMLETIKLRRNSVWYENETDAYLAVEQAIKLREMIASAELTIESIEAGVARYMGSWYKIDMAYRSYCFHSRKYKHVAVLEKISELVEKFYLNKFLLPLSDFWGDNIRRIDNWSCSTLQPQSMFFDHFVKPYLEKKQKLFIIISDALRYEAAVDFSERFQSENRWSAEPLALFGALPSYTQLGMAMLLPGNERRVNWENGTVDVDGKSASGIEGRKKILSAASHYRATAIQATEFMELNTKTDGRNLMRENDVVYIYHNVIDDTADSSVTEMKTSEAVIRAFDELDKLLKKVASSNGTHMLLTSDHGFLFQQSEVAIGDDLPLPLSSKVHYSKRRYLIGEDIKPNPNIKVYTASQLGHVGEWQAAFPLSMFRFPLQGSGKRYVHGGLSLQEILIPVVRIHKARNDDTEYIEVDLLRIPDRITTGQISLALYQTFPVSGKMLPRTIKVSVYAKDNTLLSESKSITFDSAEEDPRHRESVVVLTMSRAADDYNNKEVEIRLEETLAGTAQTVSYKKVTTKLIKPFGSDFDEF